MSSGWSSRWLFLTSKPKPNPQTTSPSVVSSVYLQASDSHLVVEPDFEFPLGATSPSSSETTSSSSHATPQEPRRSRSSHSQDASARESNHKSADPSTVAPGDKKAPQSASFALPMGAEAPCRGIPISKANEDHEKRQGLISALAALPPSVSSLIPRKSRKLKKPPPANIIPTPTSGFPLQDLTPRNPSSHDLPASPPLSSSKHSTMTRAPSSIYSNTALLPPSKPVEKRTFPTGSLQSTASASTLPTRPRKLSKKRRPSGSYSSLPPSAFNSRMDIRLDGPPPASLPHVPESDPLPIRGRDHYATSPRMHYGHYYPRLSTRSSNLRAASECGHILERDESDLGHDEGSVCYSPTTAVSDSGHHHHFPSSPPRFFIPGNGGYSGSSTPRSTRAPAGWSLASNKPLPLPPISPQLEDFTPSDPASELVHTERRYLGALLALLRSKGIVRPYVPALVDACEAFLRALEPAEVAARLNYVLSSSSSPSPSSTSVPASSPMTSPSSQTVGAAIAATAYTPAFVAHAFLDVAPMLEEALVAWCGIVGEVFANQNALVDEREGRERERRKRDSIWRRSNSSSGMVWRRSFASITTSLSAEPLSLSGGEDMGTEVVLDRRTLRELAIEPTQRVARYVLLFRDMQARMSAAPSSNPSVATKQTMEDVGIVRSALEAALRIAARCNRAQDNAMFLGGSNSSSSSGATGNPRKSKPVARSTIDGSYIVERKRSLWGTVSELGHSH